MPQTTSRPPLSTDYLHKFNHRPLLVSQAEDIRLLSLHPGSFEDPIRCDIIHASLQYEIEYEAVSYTWATDDGDASLSHRITCAYAGDSTTSDLLVTANCASALRRLRDESYERTLWIDAICIDQKNRSERSHQVELMAQIYKRAWQVLVYLGEEDLGFGSQWWRNPSKLKRLFSQRWVSRVWVIQEVALARKVSMISGNGTVQLDTDLRCRIRGCARISGLHTPAPLALEPMVNAATRDLLTMLHLSRNCHSSDPRDKVYGLMGLTNEFTRDVIKIDYSQSAEEVLTRAAAAIIDSSQDFEILAYASSSLGQRHAEGSLPTWVPDWTEHREDVLVRPQFQTYDGGPWRSLRRADLCYSDREERHIRIPSFAESMSSSRPFITVRAHCIGRVDHLSRSVKGQSPRWQSAEAFSRQVMHLIESKVDTHDWGSDFQWLAETTSFQDRSEEMHLVAQSILPFHDAHLSSLCAELVQLGGNKYIFRAGHLPAAASAGFEVGDTVWGVDGCRTPLLLRSLDEGEYRMVGNCRLLPLWHLDCWLKARTRYDRKWVFDPFRRMDVLGTQTIKIY